MDKVIAERFENVIAKADRVLSTVRFPQHAMGDTASSLLLAEWESQSLSLLVTVFDNGHAYVRRFEKTLEPGWSVQHAIESGKGVLLAAHEDFKNGYLWTIKERVHSEVFDDYLEMASYLIKDEGLKDPAAVIVGSTLEEHLRKLCQKSGIAVELNGKPKKAAVMNDDLRNVAYNQIDWRTVQGWLDIRNDAAHGHYENYTVQQVEQMIDGIRGFMARNPA